MEQLKVGEVTFTWLNGGVTHMDGGAMFGVVPKPLWSKKYPHNELNQIELRTDPILIQFAGKNILIETGIGNGKFSDKQKRNYGITEESFIQENLVELGLSTKDIDYVLMTHMHFDHASGIAKWKGEELVPTFENATIYTSEVEWNECKNPNIRSRNTYWEQNWKPIEQQILTFTEQIEILPGIRMHHTGGHSDGHSIVTIESNGELFIHMADLMPTHAHQNPLWVLAYDDYPISSIAAKEKWAKVGLDREAWYIFYHDAKYRALKWNKNLEVVQEVLREIK
ncbi:MBL fold metallo-hydrolase [Anaerobacillus alkaliphilus]|uniref:MBL fold metallo-hydrolase n=1 Tax=Anaerobacillus alkaliphilus TaxID=1548597 RepID=A0A4Q0VT61_9BACI|nr:MBL fold metallo-hydrolase [Anaerobacillus alkaliphilus]RXI98620.1 MBL fold metallo-hydrolase [Anaerobacillus alkaliphilus]